MALGIWRVLWVFFWWIELLLASNLCRFGVPVVRVVLYEAVRVFL